MKSVLERMKSNFVAARQEESGDIVQTILIIAVFVAIVVAIGALLYRVINERATTTGECIANANPVNGANGRNC